MLVCSLSSHRDLHKNKGHKSVLVRENASKPTPQCHGGFWEDSNISPPWARMTLLGTLGVDLYGPTAFGERDTLLDWFNAIVLE